MSSSDDEHMAKLREFAKLLAQMSELTGSEILCNILMSAMKRSAQKSLGYLGEDGGTIKFATPEEAERASREVGDLMVVQCVRGMKDMLRSRLVLSRKGLQSFAKEITDEMPEPFSSDESDEAIEKLAEAIRGAKKKRGA